MMTCWTRIMLSIGDRRQVTTRAADLLLRRWYGVHRGKSKGFKSFINESTRSHKFIKKLMVDSIAASSQTKKKLDPLDLPVSTSFEEFGSSLRGTATTVASGNPIKHQGKSFRRLEVLNALFMEQISSLLSTGEVSQEVLGLGLVISEVKLTTDLAKVQIFWVASGTEKDAEMEPILVKTAGRLRHELSKLRVIGVVPPIEFVKDKTHSKIAEVEHLLSICDFGDDFVPTEGKHLFDQTDAPPPITSDTTSTSDHEEVSVLSNEDGDDTTKVDAPGPEIEAESVVEESTVHTEAYHYKGVPTMRQDILGVSHGIKNMIRKQAKKKRVEQEECDNSSNPSWSESTLSQKEVREETISYRQRQRQFMKYLQKQAVTKKVVLSQMSSSAKDKEFLEEEKLDRLKRNVDALLRRMEDEDHEYEQYDEDEDDAVDEESLYYSNNHKDSFNDNNNEQSGRL